MEARPVFAWIRRFLLFLAPIAPIFVANAQAQIQMKNNFAERGAIIINNAPILLAKSGQAARASKREVRVAARGIARNQSPRRARSIAAAVATCCRWVLAEPR